MGARGEIGRQHGDGHRAEGARPWAGELLDRTGHAAALLDADSVVLECTAGLAELLGAPRTALVGRRLEDLDLPTALRVELTPVAEGGRVVRLLLELHRAPEQPEQPEPNEPNGQAGQAGRSDQWQLALDAAGMALWTWLVASDQVIWASAPQGRTMGGVPLRDTDRGNAIVDLVHPDHRDRVQEAIGAALAGTSTFEVEFRQRTAPADGERWLLARGHVDRDPAGTPLSLTGVLLDITERALARDEHARLLSAERRFGRRVSALQQVAAALSEAATSEQVAAVMVEESLRLLGADAARIALIPPAEDAAPPGAVVGASVRVVRSAGRADLLREPAVGAPARIVLPLSSRGLVRGRWTLAWQGSGQDGDWSGADGADLLRTLATECAEALDRAQLYEQQRDIATVLQRTLLPTVLPAVPGAQVAARYQPGGRGVDVGGDWYDVIALPDGRTGLVIGDVEGHSAEAAAVMGQVRNALRAYAVEGSTPAIVMERLNRLLSRWGVTRLVTCCYLEFAATEGTATVVLAGHPPPLVLRPDGTADYVPARPNLVLGVDDTAAFVETTVILDPGACLLLYTDGLIETVSRALPEGLAALRDWAQDSDPDDSTDELVENLIRRARGGLPVADDIAVLALHYRPVDRRLPSRLRAVRRTLPLDPASASAARRFVTDVLEQWGHPELEHQVALMTSELVTNSVLHTSGELELAMFRDVDRVRVEVVDRSDRLPAVQSPDADAPGGRGLLIIEALSQAWGVEGRGDGKAVWFEVALVPTAPAVPTA